jgi:hypothetical protein
MNKVILSFLAICVFASTNAQEVKKVADFEVIFGAKGGLNFSTVTGDTTDPSILVGVHFGGMAEISISEKLAVQPEVLFSMQGSSYSKRGNTQLNYLLLPVIGKYYIIENLSLEAGPHLGLLLSARDGGENVKKHTSSTDVGFNIGAGYKLENNINFSLRYSIGLTNINNEGNDRINNAVLQLSVGYFFM